MEDGGPSVTARRVAAHRIGFAPGASASARPACCWPAPPLPAFPTAA